MAGESTVALGARLRALRNSRGLSQGRLSRALWDAGGGNYDAARISKVENAKEPIPEGYVLAVGELLDATVEELPEYHLAKARRDLDPSITPLEKAVANLERFAPDPEVEEAEAVREFVAAYDELARSAAAPAAPARRAARATRRRAAS